MSANKRALRSYSYSLETKLEAVKLCNEIGPVKAAAKLGIPRSTMRSWRLAYTQDQHPTPTQTQSPKTTQTHETQTPKTTKPARRIAKVYTPSQKAQALEMLSLKGPTETSRRLGISRFSLFEWARKQREFEMGLRSDSPLNHSAISKDSRDAIILDEWKKHPGLGPSQIRNQLRRAGFKVSVRTVAMVMTQNGYVSPKVKRTQVHNQRYEAIRPNQLWHLDFMQRHIHKQKVSVLFIIDDYSRYIVGFAVCDEDRAQVVLDAFEAAVTRHGKPETVMSDGGSAFWAWHGVSQFTRLLEEMGIDQLIAKVPQHNGKVEVLNANAHKELFNQQRFCNLDETYEKLKAWVSFYNLRRTHHALGGLLVPADRYFGRSDEVLAHIEAGAAPDGIGEPISMDERAMDLMRVTSRAGTLELWMMGQRIWSQSLAPQNFE